LLHIISHFIIPLFIAWIIDKDKYFKTWIILILSMLIDIDHLLANPIYDAMRCSINFHPLHSFVAIVVYGLLLIIPKVRLFAFGLLIHIGLDAVDCLFMTSK